MIPITHEVRRYLTSSGLLIYNQCVQKHGPEVEDHHRWDSHCVQAVPRNGVQVLNWQRNTTARLMQDTRTAAHLLDVVPGLQLLQQKHSLLGLLVSLNFVVHDQGDLWDLLDAVT